MHLPDSYYSSVSDGHWFNGYVNRKQKRSAEWFIDSSALKVQQYWKSSMLRLYKANNVKADRPVSRPVEQLAS